MCTPRRKRRASSTCAIQGKPAQGTSAPYGEERAIKSRELPTIVQVTRPALGRATGALAVRALEGRVYRAIRSNTTQVNASLELYSGGLQHPMVVSTKVSQLQSCPEVCELPRMDPAHLLWVLLATNQL